MNSPGSKPETIDTSTKSDLQGVLKMIKSKAAIVVGGFIISLWLLIMTAGKINWPQVKIAFATATWLPWIPLAVLTYLLGMLLRGLRLKQLISTESNLTVTTASNIIAVGYATNNILPARLGEFARAGMLAERTGLPYALSLTVTFLERLLDGLTILSLFVLCSFVTPTDQWMKTAAAVAALLFGCAIPCVIMLAFSPQLSLSLASQFSSPLGRKWHNRALALVTQVTRGLSCLRDASTALSVLITSFLIWIIEGLMFALIMPCFNLPIDLIKALAVMAFTNLGILVPSSPGYVGTYHVCCKTALLAVTGHQQSPLQISGLGPTGPSQIGAMGEALTSISDSTAFSYAVVVHLIFYTTITVWGVIAMARYGLELGATAALAWNAKPIVSLPRAEETMAIITSVPTQKQNLQIFKVTPFWHAVVLAAVPTGSLHLDPSTRASAAAYATEFVCTELGALPLFLRLLFQIGICSFRFVTTVTNFCSFENLPLEKQASALNSWAYGPLPLTRKLFKPLRSMALLAFFENSSVISALDSASGAGDKP